MALSKEARQKIIESHRQHEKDTASPQVQVALLSARLSYLNEHFKENKKDHHSRRGLMKLVGRRRSLLDYLRKKDFTAYRELITRLGIRR